VQPATPVRPQVPQPILPQRATPATVQPHAGDAFPLPGNFTLKPRGSGQPLPEPVQKKMEAFFNTNFADVRVHVGHEAPSIGALAFTHGTDLYFAPGQYNPQTTNGQRLLGHELTHVVQQRAGRVRNPLGSGIAVVQDPGLEAEAEQMGKCAAFASRPIQAKPAAVGPVVAAFQATISRPQTAAANGAMPPARSPAELSLQPNPGRILQRRLFINGPAVNQIALDPRNKPIDTTVKNGTRAVLDRMLLSGVEFKAKTWNEAWEMAEQRYRSESRRRLPTAGDAANTQSEYVRSLLKFELPLNAIPYAQVSAWADAYFATLGFQINNTGGVHECRHGLFGAPDAFDAPQRYDIRFMEFNSSTKEGVQDVDRLERCIFDWVNLRLYPCSHYNYFIEITALPNGTYLNLIKKLLQQWGAMDGQGQFNGTFRNKVSAAWNGPPPNVWGLVTANATERQTYCRCVSEWMDG